jgi:hypothetical protein
MKDKGRDMFGPDDLESKAATVGHRQTLGHGDDDILHTPSAGGWTLNTRSVAMANPTSSASRGSKSTPGPIRMPS